LTLSAPAVDRQQLWWAHSSRRTKAKAPAKVKRSLRDHAAMRGAIKAPPA
jgi:hypothetical protein